jgi:hypothetical protein
MPDRTALSVEAFIALIADCDAAFATVRATHPDLSDREVNRAFLAVVYMHARRTTDVRSTMQRVHAALAAILEADDVLEGGPPPELPPGLAPDIPGDEPMPPLLLRDPAPPANDG